MNNLLKDRWVAGVLSAALAASFMLCVASDLSFGAILDNADASLPASTGTMTLGLSWLLGLGLHGAAVIAAPVYFLARNRGTAAG